MRLELNARASQILWKCLISMSKVGRELMLLCKAKQLEAMTINEGSSACLLLRFKTCFFSKYECFDVPEKISVSLQLLLRAFRNFKSVPVYKMILYHEKNKKLYLQLYGSYGIIRTYCFAAYSTHWKLPKIKEASYGSNLVSISASKLSAVLTQFTPTDTQGQGEIKNDSSSPDDVSFSINPERNELKIQTCNSRQIPKPTVITSTILTSVYFHQINCENQNQLVEPISVSLAELRAVILLCVESDFFVNLSWNAPGEPLTTKFPIDKTKESPSPPSSFELKAKEVNVLPQESIETNKVNHSWNGILWLSTNLVNTNNENKNFTSSFSESQNLLFIKPNVLKIDNNSPTKTFLFTPKSSFTLLNPTPLITPDPPQTPQIDNFSSIILKHESSPQSLSTLQNDESKKSSSGFTPQLQSLAAQSSKENFSFDTKTEFSLSLSPKSSKSSKDIKAVNLNKESRSNNEKTGLAASLKTPIFSHSFLPHDDSTFADLDSCDLIAADDNSIHVEHSDMRESQFDPFADPVETTQISAIESNNSPEVSYFHDFEIISNKFDFYEFEQTARNLQIEQISNGNWFDSSGLW